MEFENEIFISYGIIDNQPLIEGELGWVSNFHRSLEIMLSQLMGRKPRIWRDEKLGGNHNLTEKLQETVEKSAIFVSILSPRYLLSEWTQKEIADFHQSAQRNAGLSVGNHSRFFKVVKTPVPLSDHPSELKDLLGYEFFKMNQASGRAMEFSKVFGKEAELLFWSKLNDLAYDIHDTLKAFPKTEGTIHQLSRGSAVQEMAPVTAQPENLDISPEKTIYLAETTYDLKEQRETLKRGLVDKGFRVVPDSILPLIGPELERKVEEFVGEAKFAIHMIGETYGLVPEAANQSMVEIQNRITARRAGENGLERLIWIKPDLELEDERQEEFIRKMRVDPEYHIGAEIYESPLEAFKTAVTKKITDKKPPPVEDKEHLENKEDGSPELIYLICDQTDLDDIAKIEDFLFDAGFEVLLPAFEGDESEIRQYHKGNLIECDAVILYYGQAKDFWIRAKLRDFRKIPGYGRDKPLKHKAVYVASPLDEKKNRFRTHEALILHGSGTFNPNDLAPLTDQMRPA